MTELSDFVRALDSEVTTTIPCGLIFFSIPFRVVLGYKLAQAYSDEKGRKLDLTLGLQHGITLADKKNFSYFFDAPRVMLESDNLVAFSDDDKNILFNGYPKLIDGRTKITKTTITDDENELFKDVVSITGEQKLARLVEDHEWRGKARLYSKLLLMIWEEKLNNSKTYKKNEHPEFYFYLTRIAQIFKKEMT